MQLASHHMFLHCHVNILRRNGSFIILEFTFNAIAEFEEQQRFVRIRLAEFELSRLAEFKLQHRF